MGTAQKSNLDGWSKLNDHDSGPKFLKESHEKCGLWQYGGSLVDCLCCIS